MSEELADLHAKLRARKGQPGMAENVAQIERMIEEAESTGYVYKEAGSGHFVTADFAARNQSTTYRLKVRR